MRLPNPFRSRHPGEVPALNRGLDTFSLPPYLYHESPLVDTLWYLSGAAKSLIARPEAASGGACLMVGVLSMYSKIPHGRILTVTMVTSELQTRLGTHAFNRV